MKYAASSDVTVKNWAKNIMQSNQTITHAQAVLTTWSLKCNVFTLDLHPGFRKAIYMMPKNCSVEDGSMDVCLGLVVNPFGHAFFANVFLGGIFSQDSSYSSASLEYFKQNSIDVSAAMSMNLALQLQAKSSISISQDSYNKFVNASTFSKVGSPAFTCMSITHKR